MTDERQTREVLEELLQVEANLATLIKHGAHLRAELQERAVSTWRESGMAPTWRSDLGTVSLPIRKPRVRIAQPELFTNYVAQAHTDHAQGVITLTCSPAAMSDLVLAIGDMEDAGWPKPVATVTVDEGWQAKFLDAVEVQADETGTSFYDPANGAEIEGLRLDEGGPSSVSVRLDVTARKRAEAVASLNGDALLAPITEQSA